jgi:transposase
MGITEAATKLALSVKTYSRWVRVARAGTLMSVDAHCVQPMTELQAEVSRLKRKLAVAFKERDILKKATVYLRSNPGEVRFYSTAYERGEQYLSPQYVFAAC